MRSAEHLERLPEVNVREISEQSVVHANCVVNDSFENMSSLTGSYSRRICVRTFRVMSAVRLRVQHAGCVPRSVG